MTEAVLERKKTEGPVFPEVLEREDQKVSALKNLPFLMMHIAATGVFFTGISWTAFAIFFGAVCVRMFGLTAGYHRYFSHRSFKTGRVFQFILGFLGACSLQRDPMWWAAHHRHHHKYADTIRDTHTPTLKGFFWAHMGWVMHRKLAKVKPDPFVPDLAEYPELVFLNRHQKVPGFLFLGLICLLGLAIPHAFPNAGTSFMQILIWGFFASTVFLYHVTFSVNSFAHLFGSRPFKTKDSSRNNFWVALLTMGEGWHNNHHRFPSSEKHGLKWWEIDVAHYILKILSWIGVVWDIQTPPKESLRRESLKHA